MKSFYAILFAGLLSLPNAFAMDCQVDFIDSTNSHVQKTVQAQNVNPCELTKLGKIPEKYIENACKGVAVVDSLVNNVCNFINDLASIFVSKSEQMTKISNTINTIKEYAKSCWSAFLKLF